MKMASKDSDEFNIVIANKGLNNSGKSVVFEVVPEGIDGQKELNRLGLKTASFWFKPEAIEKMEADGFKLKLEPVKSGS